MKAKTNAGFALQDLKKPGQIFQSDEAYVSEKRKCWVD